MDHMLNLWRKDEEITRGKNKRSRNKKNRGNERIQTQPIRVPIKAKQKNISGNNEG